MVEALKCAHLTQAEFDVYTTDFKEFDLDGDGFLDKDEVTKMFRKQLEREPTEKEVDTFMGAFDTNKDGKVSLQEYVGRLCGKYEITGLTEEEAKAGFLDELKKVPVDVAKAGLKEGEYKEKGEELEKMSDEEVLEAYKKMSIAVFDSMTDDPTQQGEMLAEVLSNLDAKSADSAEVKALAEAIKAETSAS